MRFSLLALLILVTVVAVYCGLIFSTRPIVSLIGLSFLTAMMPGVIAGGVVYSQDNWRAFWIGCAAGAAPILIASIWGGFMMMQMWEMGNQDNDYSASYYLAAHHGYVVLNGILAVGMRWIYKQTAAKAKPTHGDAIEPAFRGAEPAGGSTGLE